MVAFIFVGLVIFFLFLAISFQIENYPMAVLSSIGIACMGVYIAIYNIETINNLLTQSLAMICIGFGAYILIESSVQQIQEAI